MSERSGRIFMIEYTGEINITANKFLTSISKLLLKYITFDMELDMSNLDYLLSMIENNYGLSDLSIESGDNLLIIVLKNSAGWWESIEIVPLQETNTDEDLYVSPSFTLLHFPS
jgi:hypothetical protein